MQYYVSLQDYEKKFGLVKTDKKVPLIGKETSCICQDLFFAAGGQFWVKTDLKFGLAVKV